MRVNALDRLLLEVEKHDHHTVLGGGKPFKIKLIPCIFVDSVGGLVAFVRLSGTAKFTVKV